MKLSSIAPPLLLLLLATLSCIHAHEGVLSVHGSGTTNPSKCYWKIMQQIMDRTKGAVRLTYRAVGSSTGQAEFIGADNDYTPYNDFGSGDIPISTEDYNALTTAGVEFVHLPVVLGAISLFHSVPGVSREDGKGLNLTACVIARIFKRDITTWDDPDVLTLNSGLVLPSEGYPINVAHRVHGSSSTDSVTQYLRQTCPEEWPEDMVGKEIEWPEDTQGCEGSGGMTACIRDTEGTIGYIDAGHGHDEDLQEIELQNADGNYLSSKEAKAKGGIGAAAGAVPTSADQDFGGVNLLNRVSLSIGMSVHCIVHKFVFSQYICVLCTARTEYMADRGHVVRVRSQGSHLYPPGPRAESPQGIPARPVRTDLHQSVCRSICLYARSRRRSSDWIGWNRHAANLFECHRMDL